MAALKGCVKESNLLTRNVHKFGCPHLTQNAPGPIPGQTGTWGLVDLLWAGPRSPLRDCGAGEGAAPVPDLTSGWKVQKPSDLSAPGYRDVGLGGGGAAGAGMGSLQTLCSSFSSGKQLRDATSLGIKEEKED